MIFKINNKFNVYHQLLAYKMSVKIPEPSSSLAETLLVLIDAGG